MKTDVPSHLMPGLTAFVESATGLHFAPHQWRDLQRGITAAANSMECDDVERFVLKVMDGSAVGPEMEALTNHLTVGETYFFREGRQFEVLEKSILPDLIRRRRANDRRIRIWSAACCTGEEPYSIAILLSRLIPDLENWNVTILGTDINSRFLRKAKAGVYGQWSFRDVPPWLKDVYFNTMANGQFELSPKIRKMVQFSSLNLAENSYPSPSNDIHEMDVVFCRNVLMYFKGPQAAKVVENLFRAQAEGGWLIVGPSELLHASSGPYSPVTAYGVTVYQKVGNHCSPRRALESNGTASTPLPPLEPAAAPSARPSASTHRIPPIPGASKVAPVPDPFLDALELYEKAQYAEAIEVLRTGAGFQSKAPAVRLRALCLANQGQLAAALACCDGWVASDKTDAASHYVQATVLRELGSLDEAVRSLRRAIYLDAHFVMAHFALGNIAQLRGRSAEARKHFENTLHLLRRRPPAEILTESEGITASRLLEILNSCVVTRSQA